METKTRCIWCLSSDIYKEYHDQEWGTAVYDDATYLSFNLETFQAGLSYHSKQISNGFIFRLQ
jgi:DNA-3-methyladenine glycosylase I